jgi:O-acetylhomoserine/O-acetylserine sulfhydrylase-like pyridoxal-dependent enzyme
MNWKQKVILFLLLLLIAACGLLVFSRTTASPQLNTVKITVLGSGAHRMHVPLLFDNQGGGAIAI